MAFEASWRFQEKQVALLAAINKTNEAVAIGRFVSALLLAIPAWVLSGAPWWSIPVFVVTIGWLGGSIYGTRVSVRLRRQLAIDYPELGKHF